PSGLAFDGTRLLIAATGHSRIRRLEPGGGITTTVGTGVATPFVDMTAAVSATISSPVGLAFDAGRLFIADAGNWRLRRVASGFISTVAGRGPSPPALGDGGPPSAALLAGPRGAAAPAADVPFRARPRGNPLRRTAPP